MVWTRMAFLEAPETSQCPEALKARKPGSPPGCCHPRASQSNSLAQMVVSSGLLQDLATPPLAPLNAIGLSAVGR